MRTSAGRMEAGEEAASTQPWPGLAPAGAPSAPRPAAAPRALAAHALAALAYGAITLFFFRTGWGLLGTHICPDPGDPLYLVYVLKWGMRQFHGGLPGYWAYWQAPFFFPARDALSFSEHMVGPVVLGTALSPLLPNPLAYFNLLLLASFAASGWTTWYVLRASGLPAAAAFLGGCMFAFSPFRWDQASHLQVLLAAWIPLVLWSWDRLLARPGGRRAAVFFLFYGLHVTGGTYLAYMIHFPLAAIAAVRLPRLRREGRLRAALPWLGATAAACGLVLFAIFLPYLRTSRGLERSPAEFRIWGASLPSFFTPSASNLYGGLVPGRLRRSENSLFAGFLPTALAAGAAAAAWRRLRRPPRRPLSPRRRAVLAGLAALGVLGWVWGEWKTLGPARLLPALPRGGGPFYEAPLLLVLAGAAALVLRRVWGGSWPLEVRLAEPPGSGEPGPRREPGPGREVDPWALGVALSGAVCLLLSFPVFFQPLARVVPGLAGMRVASRFYAFVSFALSFFAAGTLAALLGRMRSPSSRNLAAAGLGALLLLDLAPHPLPWVRVPREEEFPPVYTWLAGQPDVAALLELPMTDVFGEIRTMYLGTRHWKPLVNGYSGHFPASYEAIRHSLHGPVPDRELLDYLRDLGVTHILVHRRALRTRGERQALRTWEAESPVRLVYGMRGDRVYRLEPAGPRPPAR